MNIKPKTTAKLKGVKRNFNDSLTNLSYDKERLEKHEAFGERWGVAHYTQGYMSDRWHLFHLPSGVLVGKLPLKQACKTLIFKLNDFHKLVDLDSDGLPARLHEVPEAWKGMRDLVYAAENLGRTERRKHR